MDSWWGWLFTVFNAILEQAGKIFAQRTFDPPKAPAADTPQLPCAAGDDVVVIRSTRHITIEPHRITDEAQYEVRLPKSLVESISSLYSHQDEEETRHDN
ncbi:MAG TPA: hypothetical protein VF179_13100 [Thermoanaerobaculia bacterium]|nr:hypothetical protein [Thermoanaerobaculia bacterium]